MRSANAASGNAAGTSLSSSSGTTAPDGSGQVSMNYVLEGTAADLTPHIGHRIEVTGAMAGGGRGAGGRGAGGATTGTGATATAGAGTSTGTAAGAATSTGDGTGAAAGTRTGATAVGTGRGMSPRFTVTSVRMISADCSATR
jgi:hypothetical protein